MCSINKKITVIILLILVLGLPIIVYSTNSQTKQDNAKSKFVLSPLTVTDNKEFWKRQKEKNIIGEEVKRIQDEKEISTAEAIAIVTYTDEDYIDLLARLVYAEVGNLNDEAQIYAASVVLNRINDKRFPDNMYGVIYQSGQYAVVDNGKINEQASEQSYRIAKYVYENGSQIPDDVIYQAEFQQGKGIWKVVGGEYFCYG